MEWTKAGDSDCQCNTAKDKFGRSVITTEFIITVTIELLNEINLLAFSQIWSFVSKTTYEQDWNHRHIKNWEWIGNGCRIPKYNVKRNRKILLTYLYACYIKCISGTICKYEKGSPKVARNAFNIGEVCNPVCCHSNKTVQLVLWSTFGRILLLRIKHFWYKLNEISFFIIFEQNLVECMTSSLD